MKRRLSLIAAMALVLSLIGFGTLAFFTDSEEATNVITAGNIDIDLHDLGEDELPFPANGIGGVMPGSSVTKVVNVENTGDHPAFVRVRLTQAIVAAEGVEAQLNFDNITLNLDTVNWTKSGDWYYFNSILAPGEFTTDLFTAVAFGTALGNDYMNAVITIDVEAQGVQSANNGTSATAAAGWPATP